MAKLKKNPKRKEADTTRKAINEQKTKNNGVVMIARIRRKGDRDTKQIIPIIVKRMV